MPKSKKRTKKKTAGGLLNWSHVHSWHLDPAYSYNPIRPRYACRSCPEKRQGLNSEQPHHSRLDRGLWPNLYGS